MAGRILRSRGDRLPPPHRADALPARRPERHRPRAGDAEGQHPAAAAEQLTIPRSRRPSTRSSSAPWLASQMPAIPALRLSSRRCAARSGYARFPRPRRKVARPPGYRSPRRALLAGPPGSVTAGMPTTHTAMPPPPPPYRPEPAQRPARRGPLPLILGAVGALALLILIVAGGALALSRGGGNGTTPTAPHSPARPRRLSPPRPARPTDPDDNERHVRRQPATSRQRPTATPATTAAVSGSPTLAPATARPTTPSTSAAPSTTPTSAPTARATTAPSAVPTGAPTVAPTSAPTAPPAPPTNTPPPAANVRATVQTAVLSLPGTSSGVFVNLTNSADNYADDPTGSSPPPR